MKHQIKAISKLGASFGDRTEMKHQIKAVSKLGASFSDRGLTSFITTS